MFASHCENKFRPAMNCNGKCVMMKKLLAEEEKQQKNPELKLENKVEVFQQATGYIQSPINVTILSQPPATNSPTRLSDWHADFFHPPSL